MGNTIVRVIFVGPLQSNCYIFGEVDSGSGIVIDPGGDPELILSEIEQTGLGICAIVNTHAHFDHAGGNRLVRQETGAPILVHREDGPSLANLAAQAMFFSLKSENSPPPDRLLEDGDIIKMGNIPLKVLHTPGHTPGGISISGPGVVFSGDVLFAGSVGRTDLPGGSFEKMMSSIRDKLLVLPDDTRVLPGHGPETTIGRERLSNPFLA